MAKFNERFTEYTTDMGIDPALGAEILGVDEKTFYAYRGSRKTGRTPPLAKLMRIAKVFAVTSDWLSGDAAYPKWRDEVNRMRLWLRTQVRALPQSYIEQERMVAVLGMVADRLEQANQKWFLPSILGVSRERYEQLLSCEGDISTPMVERLSAFAGLPKKWIRLGDIEALENVTSAEIDPAWVEVIDQYTGYGHEPEDHLKFGPAIDDLVQRQKRMANT